MLEYKVLILDNDKVVNIMMKLLIFLNYHVILISATMTYTTIIATPDTSATTIKSNNTGAVLCKIFMAKDKGGVKNDIICKMANEINNAFNNRYCYPAPCHTPMLAINIIKIVFGVICGESMFDNEITYGIFETCFLYFFVFFFCF